MIQTAIFSGLLLAAGVSAAPFAAEANCSRDALKAATNDYIAAQASGKPNGVTAFATSSLNYTENFMPANISTGMLTQALKLDHNRTTIDTTQCATYTELIITDSKHPYVIGTQMHFAGDKLTKMQSLITQAGDWLFNATGTLYYASREDWGPIPEAKRDSRTVIQAAADAYLDVFKDKSVNVPWGTPCARLEGGLYTGKGQANDTCNVGVPSNTTLWNRQYVIDETVGAVDVFLTFQTRPDSHEFRVENGKLRFVHTITVMTNTSRFGNPARRWSPVRLTRSGRL